MKVGGHGILDSNSAEVMSEWCSEYPDYVAHAIFVKKVAEKVLEQQKLSPAERTLRKNREVEREHGMFAHRDIDKLPELNSEEIRKLKELEEAIDKETKEAKIKEEAEAVEMPLIEAELPFGLAIFERLKPLPPRLDQHDKPLYKKTRFSAAKDPHSLNSVKAFWEYVENVSGKYSVNAGRVMIAYDQSKPKAERFDKKLADYFNTFCEKCEVKTYYDPEESLEKRRLYKDICSACLQARNFVFGRTSLSDTVRTGENQVWWSYGDIAILRGDSKTLVSEISGESVLLSPWQNGGKFCSLKLDQKQILIVGPKASLHSFNKKENSLKIAYFEEMTKEQLDYLKVPERLRAAPRDES